MTEISASNYIAPERLQTDLFVIRSYQLGDGALLAAALNESYEHLRTFMPWAKPITTNEEGELRARTFRARYLLNQDYVLAIVSADETRWLGSSGFHLREGGFENRSAEIGMWIRADAAGRGLGTAVLCALVSWGFSEWPWERLSWRCSGRNVASQRTAIKAGMTLEGTLRGRELMPDGSRDDVMCFSVLKSEWKALSMREE